MIVSEARGCVDKVPDVKATCSVDLDFIIPVYPKSAEAFGDRFPSATVESVELACYGDTSSEGFAVVGFHFPSQSVGKACHHLQEERLADPL